MSAWVISGHMQCKNGCQLCAKSELMQCSMPANGQKRTSFYFRAEAAARYQTPLPLCLNPQEIPKPQDAQADDSLPLCFVAAERRKARTVTFI